MLTSDRVPITAADRLLVGDVVAKIRPLLCSIDHDLLVEHVLQLYLP